MQEHDALCDREIPMGEMSMNASENRAARKYSTPEQMWRVAWMFGQWLFRLSPRPAFAWRRFVLRCFGSRIGKEVHIYPSAKIVMPWNLVVDEWAAIGDDVLIYNLGHVHVGTKAVVSYRAHICAGTHDFSDPAYPLLKIPVTIEPEAWIGTDAFIGPGVTIGRFAMIGARAVVVRDVAPRSVVVGNPAREIGVRKFGKQGAVAKDDSC